jgi:hypothetical protein
VKVGLQGHRARDEADHNIFNFYFSTKHLLLGSNLYCRFRVYLTVVFDYLQEAYIYLM